MSRGRCGPSPDLVAQHIEESDDPGMKTGRLSIVNCSGSPSREAASFMPSYCSDDR